jgi:hypothetical protein
MVGGVRPYFEVGLVHGDGGDHGGHAVAPQTVPQHRGHQGVPVGDVGAALRQRNDNLERVVNTTFERKEWPRERM